MWGKETKLTRGNKRKKVKVHPYRTCANVGVSVFNLEDPTLHSYLSSKLPTIQIRISSDWWTWKSWSYKTRSQCGIQYTIPWGEESFRRLVEVLKTPSPKNIGIPWHPNRVRSNIPWISIRNPSNTYNMNFIHTKRSVKSTDDENHFLFFHYRG